MATVLDIRSSGQSRRFDAPASMGLPAEFIELLAGARTALDRDVHAARGYLDQISELLHVRSHDGYARHLLPSRPATEETASSPKGGLARWQIRRVADLVEQQLDATVSIGDMAAAAKLSAGHFCRAFKVSMGETPHAYIVRQRVRRAQTMMLNTGETLSSIAYACGMTDQAHLTRLFRRLVGDTPLHWRRLHRHAF